MINNRWPFLATASLGLPVPPPMVVPMREGKVLPGFTSYPPTANPG